MSHSKISIECLHAMAIVIKLLRSADILSVTSRIEGYIASFFTHFQRPGVHSLFHKTMYFWKVILIKSFFLVHYCSFSLVPHTKPLPHYTCVRNVRPCLLETMLPVEDKPDFRSVQVSEGNVIYKNEKPSQLRLFSKKSSVDGSVDLSLIFGLGRVEDCFFFCFVFIRFRAAKVSV